MIDLGTLLDSPPAGLDKGDFRILVVGNVSGKPSDETDLRNCRLSTIDRDNLDDVLRNSEISISFDALVPGGSPSQLRIESLESFHPDYIFDNLAAFSSLRKLKRQLAGDNASSAIEEIKSWTNYADTPGETGSSSTDDPEPRTEQSSGPVEITRENWFENVLETSQQGTTEPGSVNWNQWVREMIEPLSIATVEPNLDQYQDMVDKAIEMGMRSVLENRTFQRCESFWRGAEYLVRRVDSDVNVKVSVLNADVQQIADDVNQSQDLSESALYHRLVTQTMGTPGGKPWSLVALTQPIATSVEHLQALGRLTRVAAAAGTAVLSTAHFGSCNWNDEDPFTQGWHELTKSESAAWLSAVTPRFLLRLPYGKQGGHVERFRFEESAEKPNYLWGSPVWLASSCLINAHEYGGEPTQVFNVEGLPMHSHSDPELGDAFISGESLFSESQIATWIERGVTPLVSFKDSDRISINGFQSVARTPWRIDL